MFTDEWMDQQDVLYTYNEISLSLKKERIFDIRFNMNFEDVILSKISQTHVGKYCIVWLHLYDVPRIVKQ